MSVLLFFLVIVVLIIVHELGHFIAAKLFGIRVDEFGIGYPPRAFTVGKIGETLYSINWLPFGGFVRIFGESRDVKVLKEERNQAFIYKSKTAQATVLAAGVLGNTLLAFVLFSATFMLGAPTAIDTNDPLASEAQLVIDSVLAGTPADDSGFVSGDIILGVQNEEGESVATLTSESVAHFIQNNAGEDLVFLLSNMDNPQERTIHVRSAHGVLSGAPGTPAIGISMSLIANKSFGVGEALWRGLQTTFSTFKIVAVSLVKFFAGAVSGTADWSHISGPVGIVGMVGDASALGAVYLLYFVAYISVNLAIINLIPVPALDGGRLVFVAIEAITGSRVSPKLTTILNFFGFLLLIFVMLVVTYHDIVRLL